MRVKSVVSSTAAIAVAIAASVGVLTRLDHESDTKATAAVSASAGLASERLDADEAIAFWKRRVTTDPRDYLSRIQLASQYLRRGREKHNTSDAFAADAQIDRVLRVVPADIQALLVKANARSFVHDFAGSRGFARQVLEVDSTHSTAIAVASDDAFELGDLRAAATGYRELERRYGAVPEITARFPRLRHAQGDDTAALESAHQAVDAAIEGDYDPVDVAYYELVVAELERGLGHFDESATAFEDTLARRPDYGGAIEGLGKVRAAQGRYDDSEKLWRKSGKLIGSRDFHVLSALGDLAYAHGHVAEARRFWDQALDAVDALSERERIGFLRDESRFRAARSLDPYRALELAAQDMKVRQDAFAYDTLAWAQVHTGDVSGALASMSHAILTGIDDAGVWYHSAVIYEAAGDHKTTLERVEHTLDLNPEFDLYEAAQARNLLDRLT